MVVQIIYIAIVVAMLIMQKILKNKKEIITPIVLCLYLAIVMGGQQNNPDYSIYVNIFRQSFYSKDPGFGVVIQLLKNIGFNQYNFRLGIAIIGFTLISITVFRFIENRTLFYILYGIYPFLFDVVQARNFLVMSILVFAVPLLVDGKLKNKFLYIALIIVAATIQKIAIVYLPLVFCNRIRNGKYTKYFWTIIITVSVFVAFNRSVLIRMINMIIIPLTGNLEGLSNYVNVNTRFGWIIFWAEQIFAFLIIRYANKLESSTMIAKIDDKNVKRYNFVSLMNSVNYYMFIFLPLFIIDENYTRIIRNLIPLNLIACIIVLTKHRKKIFLSKKRLLLLGGVLLYQLVMLLLLIKGYSDTIVIPTFFENWIF